MLEEILSPGQIQALCQSRSSDEVIDCAFLMPDLTLFDASSPERGLGLPVGEYSKKCWRWWKTDVSRQIDTEYSVFSTQGKAPNTIAPSSIVILLLPVLSTWIVLLKPTLPNLHFTADLP